MTGPDISVAAGSSVLRSDSPPDGIPDGAVRSPDPPAAAYDAATAAVNAGSHAARTGYYSTPVTDLDVLRDRASALGGLAGAALIAAAILRDATEQAHPAAAAQVAEAVRGFGFAADVLRDLADSLDDGAPT